MSRKGLIGSHIQQQQQLEADTSSSSSDSGSSDSISSTSSSSSSSSLLPAATTSSSNEFSIDLSKLSLEQLERLREKAREKQWEDEWWKQYVKYENDKKAVLEKEYKQKEKQTIAQYNITLTRLVGFASCCACLCRVVFCGLLCLCTKRKRRRCSHHHCRQLQSSIMVVHAHIQPHPPTPKKIREAVHKLAKDGYLFVTWANHHYTDFAMSWVKHLKKLGLTNFLVGAMDDDVLSTLARRAIPTFSMQSGKSENERMRRGKRRRGFAGGVDVAIMMSGVVSGGGERRRSRRGERKGQG